MHSGITRSRQRGRHEDGQQRRPWCVLRLNGRGGMPCVQENRDASVVARGDIGIQSDGQRAGRSPVSFASTREPLAPAPWPRFMRTRFHSGSRHAAFAADKWSTPPAKTFLLSLERPLDRSTSSTSLRPRWILLSRTSARRLRVDASLPSWWGDVAPVEHDGGARMRVPFAKMTRVRPRGNAPNMGFAQGRRNRGVRSQSQGSGCQEWW